MIPRILHYCFGLAPDFGGKAWGLSHYVCLRSAVERIAPSRVNFYYEHEPSGPWWALTRDLITPVKIKAPTSIFGNRLYHPAHQTDVLRLEKLIEYGGIYLDADVFVHRSFEDLLDHTVVMGEEVCKGQHGLCNGVILAERDAAFLKRWHATFSGFRSKGRDRYWAEYAVHMPLRLAAAFPDEISVLPPSAFFSAGWDAEGLERLFVSETDSELLKGYANHLWEGAAWEKYFGGLTPGEVRARKGNFYKWATPLLEGLEDDYGADHIAGPSTRSSVESEPASETSSQGVPTTIPGRAVAAARLFGERRRSVGWKGALRLRAIEKQKIRSGNPDGVGPVIRINPAAARYELSMRTHPANDYETAMAVFDHGIYAHAALSGARGIIHCGAGAGYALAFLLSRNPEARAIAVEADAESRRLCSSNLEPYGAQASVLRTSVQPAAGNNSAAGFATIPQLIEQCGGFADLVILDMGRTGLDILAADASWISRVGNLAVRLGDLESWQMFFRAMGSRTYELKSEDNLTFCFGIRDPQV